MADLVVSLYGEDVGRLVGTDWRTFDFHASTQAIETFGLGSTMLSESMPLEVTPTPRGAGKRRNFFSELLPEGQLLNRLAGQAGIPAHDVIGMLARYGRDIAGAMQIHDPDAPGEPRTPHTEPVTDESIGAMFRDATLAPLGNDRLTGRTSLGGVQDKIVLARIEGAWHQVHDGAPSTHIVKVPLERRPHLIFDEEYGARAARALGLAAFDTHIADFDGVAALVVERYDRDPAVPGGRIHQEDMNQALGAFGAMKYQGAGSPISLLRISDVFLAYGDTESQRRLLRHVTLAIALGNLDLHAKNISIIHHPGTAGSRTPDPTLAPAYDMVPTRRYLEHAQVAMHINGEARHPRLTAADLVGEAESWGLRGADSVVDEALRDVSAFLAAEAPLPGSDPTLHATVSAFTERLLAGGPVGDPPVAIG